MGLLWSAYGNLSNSVMFALHAMTVPEVEGAVMLFVVFMQLLEVCGAIQNFIILSTFALQRIDLSR